MHARAHTHTCTQRRLTAPESVITQLHLNAVLGMNNDAGVWALGLLTARAALLTFWETVRVVSIYLVSGQQHPALNINEHRHICISIHRGPFLPTFTPQTLTLHIHLYWTPLLPIWPHSSEHLTFLRYINSKNSTFLHIADASAVQNYTHVTLWWEILNYDPSYNLYILHPHTELTLKVEHSRCFSKAITHIHTICVQPGLSGSHFLKTSYLYFKVAPSSHCQRAASLCWWHTGVHGWNSEVTVV